MTVDVDVLSRYYDPLTARHIAISNTYCILDMNNFMDAYSTTTFDNLLLNNKYMLKPSTKRKFAACNLIMAVTPSSSAALALLLSLYYIADE